MRFHALKHRPRLSAAAALLLSVAGCGDEPRLALRVGGASFTAEQIAELRPPQLEALADLAAFASAVSANDVDSLIEPIVRYRAEPARLELLPVYLAAERLEITEADLRRAYEARPEPELIVRHLVRLVPEGGSAATRERARNVAAEARSRALAGEDFARVAAELSEEPGAAERGGLLRPGRRGTWVEPFWEAAAALEPGEISPVVESPFGYHVIELQERRSVPFEEADRTRILSRLVDADAAQRAMDDWLAQRGSVLPKPPAVAAARRALQDGRMPDPDTLAEEGEEVYTGRELALGWAALPPERRESLARAGDAEFGGWVQDEARQWLWARRATEVGAPVPEETMQRLGREWNGRAAAWTDALGAGPDQSPAEISAAALRALASSGQEQRIARRELAGLRPLLRERYRAAGPAATELPSSSSESLNSESTR